MSGVQSRIAEFLDRVERSGIVPGKVLAEVRGRADTFADPLDLAARLVADKVLTKFQADQFLAGRTKLTIGGRYHVCDRLGSGGMGKVFLCRHAVMGNLVAVKILNTDHSQDERSRERFRREARAVASLNHPNVVRAFEMDQDGPHPFLVMEYVPGETAHVRTLRRGRLPAAEAAAIACQAALGLDHARLAGLVHRDVKPANILVDQSGCVKILDLGLALFTDEELKTITRGAEGNAQVLGTADFLAPEQALDSHTVDSRADIYSLGATLYFMLSGRPPFQGKNLAEKFLAHQVREPDPLPPEVPAGLVAIVRTMMAKRPEARFPTPGAAADALRPWAGLTTASGRITVDLPPERVSTAAPSGINLSGRYTPLPSGVTDIGASPTPSPSMGATIPINRDPRPDTGFVVDPPEPEPTSTYDKHRRADGGFPWKVTVAGVLALVAGAAVLVWALKPPARPPATEPTATAKPPTSQPAPPPPPGPPDRVPDWVVTDLARWEFTNGRSSDASFPPAVQMTPRVRVSPLVRGPGLAEPDETRHGAFNAKLVNGKPPRTLVEAIGANTYFEFTLTPAAGTALSLDAVEFHAFFERYAGGKAETRGAVVTVLGDTRFEFPLIFKAAGTPAVNTAGHYPLVAANDTAAVRRVAGPLTVRLFLYGYDDDEVVGLGGSGPDVVVTGMVEPVPPADRVAAAAVAGCPTFVPPTPPVADAAKYTARFAGVAPKDLPAELLAALRERNPGAVIPLPEVIGPAAGSFDRVNLLTRGYADISPLAGLRTLSHLSASGELDGERRPGNLSHVRPLRGLPLTGVCLANNPDLTDIAPLAGAPIAWLDVAATGVRDLGPVAANRLGFLHAHNSKIRDLRPVAGHPLTALTVNGTRVRNLDPIRGMPLRKLWAGGAYPVDSWDPVRETKTLADLELFGPTAAGLPDLTVVRDLPNLRRLLLWGPAFTDLSPLAGAPLVTLILDGTGVSNLAPLRGVPLTSFVCSTTLPDLSPLVDSPLRAVKLHGDLKPHAAVLRGIRTLTSINGRPAAEVLRELDAKTPPKSPAG